LGADVFGCSRGVGRGGGGGARGGVAAGVIVGWHGAGHDRSGRFVARGDEVGVPASGRSRESAIQKLRFGVWERIGRLSRICRRGDGGR
jgi:hypothetical protein